MGHEKHKGVALLRRVCVQVCIVCACVCVSMCMMRFKLYVHNALGMHRKVKSWAFGLQMKCCNNMKHLCFCYVKPHSSRFSNQLFETMLFTYWSCVLSFLSLNQQTSLHTIKSRSVLNDSLCVLSLPVCLCVFVCLLANWSTSAFSISPTQEEKKTFSQCCSLSFSLSNLPWAAGVQAEGLSLSRDVNLQPFQFHPTLQSPYAWTISRPGQRCHLLFISSMIREERKALYIVMLSHLSDISKIEVQVKDQYKLKVNTKEAMKRRRYMFESPFALSGF